MLPVRNSRTSSSWESSDYPRAPSRLGGIVDPERARRERLGGQPIVVVGREQEKKATPFESEGLPLFILTGSRIATVVEARSRPLISNEPVMRDEICSQKGYYLPPLARYYRMDK